LVIVVHELALNKEIEEFVEDVDGQGNSLTMFAGLTFFNGINSAIDWIFVDYPVVDQTAIRTKADQKAANIKPFWTHVLGRNILRAKSNMSGGKHVLTHIKIFEPGVGELDRVRIFEKVGEIVTWQLWEKSEKAVDGKSRFNLINQGTLSINVIPLVPFATGRRDGSTFKFHPPMTAAVDLQEQLYQDESALKFAKTLTGYPMLSANGMRPEMEADGKTPKKMRVGPGVILWSVPNGNGQHGEWKFVEITAASLNFLKEDIKETKLDLRELGRQPLTAQSGNLTVINSAVAAGKARSAVSAWALMLKDALENALLITCLYMRTAEEPEVNVYTEFDAFLDGAADLAELGQARRTKDISRRTYWTDRVTVAHFNFAVRIEFPTSVGVRGCQEDGFENFFHCCNHPIEYAAVIRSDG